MTKYFLDTEFIDTGEKIELISLGLVSQDGREYYVQSCEYNPNHANAWVVSHVFPSLVVCPGDKEYNAYNYRDSLFVHWGKCSVTQASGAPYGCPWRTRKQIQTEIALFCDPKLYGRPEFVGWCGSYDFVALCQLFGTMMELPPKWPHCIIEFQNILDERQILDEELPTQEHGLHNALSDAHHLKKLWGYVVNGYAWQ